MRLAQNETEPNTIAVQLFERAGTAAGVALREIGAGQSLEELPKGVSRLEVTRLVVTSRQKRLPPAVVDESVDLEEDAWCLRKDEDVAFAEDPAVGGGNLAD
jgi:Ribonuclease G/E